MIVLQWGDHQGPLNQPWICKNLHARQLRLPRARLNLRPLLRTYGLAEEFGRPEAPKCLTASRLFFGPRRSTRSGLEPNNRI